MYPRGYIFKWLLKTPLSIWIQGRDSRKGLGFNEGRKKRRKEGVQGRKEQKGKMCVCTHVHQAGPHHKFTPGSTSTWRRGIKKGKGRAGKGREWKGRAGKGREGKSRGATYNHPLPRCTLSPSQSGPLPVPVSILPLGNPPNETTSLGTWWSSTSVLKKKPWME